MPTPTLRYNGKLMNPEPVNVSLADARRRLKYEGAVFVSLEPGDATRYDLVVAHVGECVLMVARIDLTDTIQRCVCIDTVEWVCDDLLPLCTWGASDRPNVWTMQLLDWSLRLLIGHKLPGSTSVCQIDEAWGSR